VGLFGNKLNCKKEYPWSSRDISLGVKIPDLFLAANVVISKKINRTASELAILMDDFQHEQCLNAERCEKKSPERRYYLELRDTIQNRLFMIRTTMITLGNNPKKLQKFLERNLNALNTIIEREEKLKEMKRILESKNIGSEVNPENNLELKK